MQRRYNTYSSPKVSFVRHLFTSGSEWRDCYSGVINGIDVHTQMLVAYFRYVTRTGAFKDFENDLSLCDQFIAAGN